MSQDKTIAQDYYERLKIPETASQTEIVHRFRMLAKDLHPDNNPLDSTQQFIDLCEAYRVLKTKKSRKAYDSLRSYRQGKKRAGKETIAAWEKTVAQAAETGRVKGEKLTGKFSFFSKNVITGTSLVLVVTLLLTAIFGLDIFSSLVLSFLIMISGIFLFFFSWGTVGTMLLGLVMTVGGFFWFRAEIRREFGHSSKS